MRFAKRLKQQARDGWEAFYLNYKSLKKSLVQTQCSSAPGTVSPDLRFSALLHLPLRQPPHMQPSEMMEQIFVHQLQSETLRVNQFYFAVESECAKQLHAAQQNHHAGSVRVAENVKAIIQLAETLHALRLYVLHNYIAIVRIVHKRNKRAPQTSKVIECHGLLVGNQFFKSTSLNKLLIETEDLGLDISFSLDGFSIPDPRPSCCACGQTAANPMSLLGCHHLFCWDCLWKTSPDLSGCPTCQTEVLVDLDAVQVERSLPALLVRLLGCHVPATQELEKDKDKEMEKAKEKEKDKKQEKEKERVSDVNQALDFKADSTFDSERGFKTEISASRRGSSNHGLYVEENGQNHGHMHLVDAHNFVVWPPQPFTSQGNQPPTIPPSPYQHFSIHAGGHQSVGPQTMGLPHVGYQVSNIQSASSNGPTIYPMGRIMQQTHEDYASRSAHLPSSTNVLLLPHLPYMLVQGPISPNGEITPQRSGTDGPVPIPFPFSVPITSSASGPLHLPIFPSRISEQAQGNGTSTSSPSSQSANSMLPTAECLASLKYTPLSVTSSGQSRNQQQLQPTDRSSPKKSARTSFEIFLDMQPPGEVRTRTPKEIRNFSLIASIDPGEDGIPDGKYVMRAELMYATPAGRSEPPQPFPLSREIFGGPTCVPVERHGCAVFSGLTVSEASARHREREFCIKLTLHDTEHPTVMLASKVTNSFYAFSHKKVLERKKFRPSSGLVDESAFFKFREYDPSSSRKTQSTTTTDPSTPTKRSRVTSSGMKLQVPDIHEIDSIAAIDERD